MTTKSRLGQLLAVSMEEARVAESAEVTATDETTATTPVEGEVPPTDGETAPVVAEVTPEAPASTDAPATAETPEGETAAAAADAAADAVADAVAADPVVEAPAATDGEVTPEAIDAAAAAVEEAAPAAEEAPAAGESTANADAASTSTDAVAGDETVSAEGAVTGALIGAAAGMTGPLGGAIGGGIVGSKLAKKDEEIARLRAKLAKHGISHESLDDDAIADLATAFTDAPAEEAPVVVEEVTPVAEETPAAAVVEEVPAVIESPVVAEGEVVPVAGEEAPAVVIEDPAVAAEKLVMFHTKEEDAAVAADAAAAADAGLEPAAAEPIVAAEPVVEEARVEDAVVEPVVEAPAAVVEETAPVVDVIQVADPETLEGDLVDIGDAAAVVDENSEAVSELGEIQEGLEAIALALESAAAEGGLTPQAARFMSLAVESYTGRLGEDNTVPSMESFGGLSTRTSATNVSLESVQETLLKVWNAIKAIVAKVRDAMVDFAKKLLLGTEKLKARAEALKAAAAKLSGSPTAASVDAGSIAVKLAVGNTVKFDAGSLNQLIDLAKQATEYDLEAGKVLVSDYDVLRKFANGDATSTDWNQVQGLAAPKIFNKKSGDKLLLTPVLPGNVSFGLERFDLSLFGKNLSVFTATKEVTSAQVSSTEIKVLSAAELSKIADEALQLVGIVEAANQHIAQNAKVVKGHLKDLKISPKLDQEKLVSAKIAMTAFRQRATQADQLSTKVLAHAITTARAYIAAGEKCVAAYAGEAKAA